MNPQGLISENFDFSKELDNIRKKLLDLGTRNRLISFHLDGKKVIRVVGELPNQVYDILVKQKKAMKFGASDTEALDDDQLEIEDILGNALDQPDDFYDPETTRERQSDLILQTRLSGKILQARLLHFESDAKAAIEEQGINILYLALGFLKWYDVADSENVHYAPLILVPIKLTRDSARSKFKIEWSEEDIVTNESLAYKLQSDFHITLPRLLEESTDILPTDYFSQVKRVIRSEKQWEITDDITLDFFTFAKLLMWKDLDLDNWPDDMRPNDHNIIRAIFQSNPLSEPSPYKEDDFIDHKINLHDMMLVTDADSSQTLAVLDVNDNRSIAVQGPPGTGKSQTIANIIASSLARGKTILFVAEKMAALEVVKRRLDKAGIGNSCLELHSFKAKKTFVMEKIRDSIDAPKPILPDRDNEIERIKKLLRKLNDFSFAMNTPLVKGGITPQRAVGIIHKYSQPTLDKSTFRLADAAEWTISTYEENLELAKELARHFEKIVNPVDHPWRGANLKMLLPADKNTLKQLTDLLIKQACDFLDNIQSGNQELGLLDDLTIASGKKILSIYHLLSERPSLLTNAITNPIWESHFAQIEELINYGIEYQKLKTSLSNSIKESAFEQEFDDVLYIYRYRGKSVFRFFFSEYWYARKEVISICFKSAIPKNYGDTIILLEELCRLRILMKAISSQNKIGEGAFSELWMGLQSNWQDLLKIVEWMGTLKKIIESFTIPKTIIGIWKDIAPSQVIPKITSLTSSLDTFEGSLKEWIDLVQYDLNEGFGATAENIPIDKIHSRLKCAINEMDSINDWIAFRRCLNTCNDRNLNEFAELILNGAIEQNRIVTQFAYSFGNEVLRKTLNDRKILQEFSGTAHENLIEQFRYLDKQLLKLTRQYLAAKMWELMPQPTTGDPDSSSMNYLTSQLRKKRCIPPIREIMKKAGYSIPQKLDS